MASVCLEDADESRIAGAANQGHDAAFDRGSYLSGPLVRPKTKDARSDLRASLFPVVRLTLLFVGVGHRFFFFFAPVVFLLEFFDTAGGVHKLHLAGVERMRSGRDFHFEQWIFIAIFPRVRFFTLDCRLQEKPRSVRGILEDDISVFRVDLSPARDH